MDDLERCLMALRLEAPDAVVDDVERIIRAKLAAAEARYDELYGRVVSAPGNIDAGAILSKLAAAEAKLDRIREARKTRPCHPWGDEAECGICAALEGES